MKTEFGFIGWCKDDAANHDKIWGYFYRPTREYDNTWSFDKKHGQHVVIFWARRGKAMQFKPDIAGYTLDNYALGKQNKKDYRKISVEEFLTIWPSFIQECEEKLMWDVLAGKVK